MVYHCINKGVCMGMDEGFTSFGPTNKHKFREELEAFCGFSDENHPSNDGSMCRKPMHLL